MKRSATFHNGTLALLAFAAFSTGPAFAQRNVEFGYKDRIFEQKYVLPDSLSVLEAQNYMMVTGLQALAAGGADLFDRRLIDAAGGLCAVAVIMKQPATEMTPAQAAIDKTPKTREPESMEVLMRKPASQADKCVTQLMLFREAFADSLSMDHQLAGLARAIRSRFASEWLSQAEASDPQMQQAAVRLHSISSRISRLSDRGISLPQDVRVWFEAVSWRDGLLAVKDGATYAKMDVSLTAAEEAADRSIEERKQQQQAEAARSEQERRQQEAAIQQRLEQERQIQEAETAERRVAAARAEEIRDLERERDRLERDISPLRSRLAIQQQNLGRSPVGSPDDLSTRRTIARLQSELNSAVGRKVAIEQRLGYAQGGVQQATTSASSGVRPDSCQQGGMCRVIETTLFCRTLQQMAAILSQRPGPARKQVLTVLVASGDCRQIAQGETLQWTAPIAMVQPQGEAMAELVPGTLADGTAGFLLKDGVITRTGIAAR
jgi:hypothetical protein